MAKLMEIYQQIADELQARPAEVQRTLRSFFRRVEDVLVAGDGVSIPGIGRIFSEVYPERRVTSGFTGKQYKIPRRTRPRLNPNHTLIGRMNEGLKERHGS